jgi:hypothetical protein
MLDDANYFQKAQWAVKRTAEARACAVCIQSVVT